MSAVHRVAEATARLYRRTAPPPVGWATVGPVTALAGVLVLGSVIRTEVPAPGGLEWVRTLGVALGAVLGLTVPFLIWAFIALWVFLALSLWEPLPELPRVASVVGVSFAWPALGQILALPVALAGRGSAAGLLAAGFSLIGVGLMAYGLRVALDVPWARAAGSVLTAVAALEALVWMVRP